MELLYVPPSLRHFEPRWLAHEDVPGDALLGYDLVEALRPRMCVDLGAGRAAGFFAMCESAREHDVDCILYAIDSWADDEANESGGAVTSASINNFLHTHFRGIAYLLRMGAEDALQHFPEGSIDLLRVDAGRVGRPMSELLAAWLPRLSAEGVLVATGVATGEGAESFRSAANGRGMLVPSGSGAGVVRSGAAAPGPTGSALLDVLSSGTDADRTALGEFYVHVTTHHALRREVCDFGGNLFRKKATAP